MMPAGQQSLPNTMGLSSHGQFFARFESLSQLLELLRWAQRTTLPVRVLGAGSNVLLPEYVPGLIVQNGMGQHRAVRRDGNFCWVVVDGGCPWHQWVLDSIQYGHGVENLALIPGTVGAAPIQNIGAYGVELADVLEWVEGIQLSTGQLTRWSIAQCRFAYRDSVFKRELRGDVIITRVCFRLARRFDPDVSYGPLAQWAQTHEVTPVGLIEQVCEVRRSKLPDPQVLANAGSFFKNPLVAAGKAEQLQRLYPNMPKYPAGDAVKLAAGWLIETVGWKGKRLGPVGMHDQQALVLVNHGAATLADVQALVRQVQKDVLACFDVLLEPEPQLFAEA